MHKVLAQIGRFSLNYVNSDYRVWWHLIGGIFLRINLRKFGDNYNLVKSVFIQNASI